ncbi:RHS repeat protein [Chromobacterium haemolyticum]|uniref:RHS repeat protein n=1 Tax=Chromobacterium fluminis TaxID=3044269 RepID=A0ABX0LCW7_9NEIS|nr:RHS repeat protein [Chromobacterium haemolyticum]NHR07256.1 RHS repeat protein [Chromobacterium haemolyticum]
MATTPNLCVNTPDLTVLGPQGQTIRQLRYHRAEADQAATERIERHAFHTLGHLLSSQDARFFAEAAGTCNFRYHSSLSGQVLYTQSTDAGESWLFCDIEGRPVWQHDARGTVQRYLYDVLGRLTSRQETIAGAETIAECRVYGEAETEAKLHNLRGQLTRHYDTVGLLDNSQSGYALSGSLLGQQRRLLEIKSDWRGACESEWEQALTRECYATVWQYDLNGQILMQTDAGGHHQRFAYDVTGRLKASWVKLNGGLEREVLRSSSYSAAGQKLREEAGNGVITSYRYEAETQRLLEVETTRTAEGGRKTLLQRLRYGYDSVGNILSIHSDAETARYFKNQQVAPDQIYRYDSLYQLIAASGREHAAAPNPTDDPASPRQDSANYVNYSRTYQYDVGGNLTSIAHRGAASYTRHFTVSASSNHAVPSRAGLLPEQVRSLFDAAGNQKQLDTGQVLQWNGLNQLRQVITSFRSIGHDRERYLYGADGMRVRKTSYSLVEGKIVQQQDVIYLPGLELRTTGQVRLQVLTIGVAGRSQVRLLNWLSEPPKEIANQQLRYSLDDHQGSSQLELDSQGDVLTQEEYYAYGGTAIRAGKSACEVKFKAVRYSGKERDASGLYYYGLRYYQPWLGRWLNPDPAGTIDGLNLFRMARNNPVSLVDKKGLMPKNSIKNEDNTTPKNRALKLPDNLQDLLTKEYWIDQLDSKQKIEIASPKFWNDKSKKTKERRLEDILGGIGSTLLEKLDNLNLESGKGLSLFRSMSNEEAAAILAWSQGKKDDTERLIRRGGVSAKEFRGKSTRDGVVGIIPVRNHFGDKGQAENYYNKGENKMLEFKLKSGAEKLIFSTEYLAIARAGRGASRAMISTLGAAFPEASKNEGVLSGYIGVKSEDHGPFSLGVGESDPSRLLLQLMIESVREAY